MHLSSILFNIVAVFLHLAISVAVNDVPRRCHLSLKDHHTFETSSEYQYNKWYGTGVYRILNHYALWPLGSLDSAPNSPTVSM